MIVDEAYCEYATAADFPRSLELMARHPNLIVSRTFSKIFGMAGLRLGYGFAHPLVVRECARVKTPFNVNLAAQTAALAALQDADFVARSVGNNNLGRLFLEDAFRRLGLDFLPTQANFICFRTARQAVDIHEDLLKQGVIVRPLRSFGLDYWTRVTIGTPEQNERFVAASSREKTSESPGNRAQGIPIPSLPSPASSESSWYGSLRMKPRTSSRIRLRTFSGSRTLSAARSLSRRWMP